MEEILLIAQNYRGILVMAGGAFLGLVLLIYLIRILRQIKRLNKSLKSISENIQAYVEVVLSEDEEIEESTKAKTEQAEIPSQNREREKYVPFAEEQKRMEDERLFNSVLQEYFS